MLTDGDEINVHNREVTEYTSNPEAVVEPQPQGNLRAMSDGAPVVDIIFLVDTTSSMVLPMEQFSRKLPIFERSEYETTIK